MSIAGHVESALQQLAECIGADRAYFVGRRYNDKHPMVPRGCRIRAGLAGSRVEPRCRALTGMKTASFTFPRSGRPRHDTMNLLADAGVRGWLCMPAVGDSGSRSSVSILCGPGRSHPWSDFPVFRMAFDAIGNAVNRVKLEQEKERLAGEACNRRGGWRRSAPLPAASRTTSTISSVRSSAIRKSPIARIRSRGGPAASLAEIRRAGERARELVDQIFDFGRRGEGRRERLCIRTLIAETQITAGRLVAFACQIRGERENSNDDRLGRAGAIAAGHFESLQQRGAGDE